MKSKELADLTDRVQTFLKEHKLAIGNITSHASHVFESICFVVFARHYENLGYHLLPKNLQDGKFRFRYSTNGLPWRYSYFVVYETNGQNLEPLFEIWHNQKVAGAWIGNKEEELALFAVDIAVTRSDSLPSHLDFKEPQSTHQYWVSNSDLITFGEAKKLAGYPMLIAQFIGIVHEIKPDFMDSGNNQAKKLIHDGHPPPILMTANVMTEGARRVIKSVKNRKISIIVVDNVLDKPDQEIVNEIFTQVKTYTMKEIKIPVSV